MGRKKKERRMCLIDAREKRRKMRSGIIGYAVFGIALQIIFTQVLMLAVSPTESMAGTISPGDLIVSTRYGVGEEDIGRYDVLIFTLPDNPEMTYLKRVVGLPGETIEVKNGKVYADGIELDNSFTKGPQNRSGDGTYVVPDGCYFFLGDNRNNSKDSRFWKEKYVPAANIQAKARFVFFPFRDASWL